MNNNLDDTREYACDVIKDYYNELYDERLPAPWQTPNLDDVRLYSAYLWTLDSLYNAVRTSTKTPLMVVDGFKDKMIEYAQINSELWQPCVDCCGCVIDLLV